MASNYPKQLGAGGSTSFRYDEVNAMCQLMDTLFRGGDGQMILRQKAIKTVYGKFKRMKTRLDELRDGADPETP